MLISKVRFHFEPKSYLSEVEFIEFKSVEFAKAREFDDCVKYDKVVVYGEIVEPGPIEPGTYRVGQLTFTVYGMRSSALVAGLGDSHEHKCQAIEISGPSFKEALSASSQFLGEKAKARV